MFDLKKLLSVAGFLMIPCVLFCQMRELSFYEVRPRIGKITIDGKLDEDAWKKIPVHQNYYEYWKNNPKPGALKTTYRMVYDETGLYMAVVNYDDNIPALKRTISEYDNGSIWTDDCGEFYFDPAANGIGYTKITINANGAFADMRRMDAAVTLSDWNGIGTLTAASIGKDAWYIEAFFPWEDLNGVPKPGSLWQFCHARFSWTKGFRGMASSPGGNYNATDKFGYLYFSDGKTALDPARIGALLQTKAAVPWCIPCGEILVSCTGSVLKMDLLAELVKAEADKYRLYLLEIETIDSKSFAKDVSKVCKDIESVKNSDPMTRYRAYQNANSVLFGIKWNILLNKYYK